MERLLGSVLLVLILVLGCIAGCTGDTLWDYQVVNEIGYGIHPKVWADETDPESRITIEGVALAGYNEILNPNVQYTVFVQDHLSDRGGMQAWTGKFFYGDELWAILRTTDYIDFEAGDLLRITGLIADMGRGKVVINNRGHSGAPNLIWHVDIIGHLGLPDPELIPSVSHCNYFDYTRAGGGERYQTRYVMLHGVQIASGVWGNNKLMTIGDPTGTVGMLLSLMGDFGGYSQPTGKINVVGIFDQEDDQVAPYTDGYRIWVKRMSDIAEALEGCREVRAKSEGQRVALVNKVVSRVYDGYFYVQDQGRSGGTKVISSREVSPGNVVHIQGLVTNDNGEQAIIPNYLTIGAEGDAPRALRADSRVLRGTYGLDMDGLLVKVFGRLGADQGGGVYSLTDGSGSILVRAGGISMPTENTLVGITGVAKRDGNTPVLLIAGEEDVQIINQ